MLRRIVALIRKEFIQVARDPRTLGIILVMPTMQLLAFGYAINTVVDHLPTVVFDQSRDGASREFLQAFVNTGYFDFVGEEPDVAAVRAAVDAGRAKVGLVIPPDFGADLAAGRPATAQLVVDGSDPNIAQTALFVGTAVAQRRAAERLLTTGRAVRDLPIDLRPVVLYNPAMLSVNFMIPGLIGVVLQFQALILTAFAIVRERERGTLEQLIVTPISPVELMLGKILPYIVIAFCQVGVVTALGTFWFGVEFAGDPLLLFVLAFFFLLGSLGLGLLVSTVAQTQTQALQMAVFIIMPSFVLSGFVFPREAMPPVVSALGLGIPLTYFLKVLRGIILKGVGLEVLWPEAVALLVFGLVVFTLSALRFQKKLG